MFAPRLAAEWQWGLFHLWPTAPAVSMALSLILLDFASMFNTSPSIGSPARSASTGCTAATSASIPQPRSASFRPETSGNFGFSAPYWDRLCRTYCAEPRARQRDLDIGLPELRGPERLRLPHLILLPWHRPY